MKDRLKILITTGGHFSVVDGTNIRSKGVYEILSEQSDAIFFRYKKLTFNLPKVKFLFLMPYWIADLLYMVIKHRFDHIYCSHDRYGFLILYLFRRIFKYKLIYEAHSIISEEFENAGKNILYIKSKRCLENFVASHADGVVAVSENAYTYFQKYNKNIEIIPVFKDTNFYKLNQTERMKIRQKYTDSKIIGIIGPFNIDFNKYFLTFLYKNIDLFDRRIKFMIIGDYNNNRIDNKRIIYIGYTQNYIGYLSSIDCVLIPSKIATSGPLNKILEPMSLGLPVFTTPQGLVGLDHVTPGKDIFVFEEDELVDKINKLILDDELMAEIGRNARIVVKKYYSKEGNEKKLIAVIKGLYDQKLP